MEKVVINAERRTVTGKKVGALRRAGKLPGVIYGHHLAPIPILMDLRDATKILSGLTGSSLVTIAVDGEEHAALVREKQRNYIRGTYTHIDFQAVSLTEKIRAKVGVIHQGLSPAVKDYNGVVVTGLSELEVESLPRDLPESFVVDLSTLKNIGDAIYVRDIQVSDKVEMLDNPDEMLVIVTAAKEEVVEEAAAPGAEEPEVIEKGKKEEEEG